MIFVTVGSQLSFDRLVKSMDRWAEQNPSEPCVAQISQATYLPQHMEWHRALSSQQFRETFGAARIVVSHAGVGTILMAMELRKPLIIMPRRADLGEHRNDHQMAMIRKLQGRLGTRIALDEADLVAALAVRDEDIAAPVGLPHASEELLQTVREFIRASDRRLP